MSAALNYTRLRHAALAPREIALSPMRAADGGALYFWPQKHATSLLQLAFQKVLVYKKATAFIYKYHDIDDARCRDLASLRLPQPVAPRHATPRQKERRHCATCHGHIFFHFAIYIYGLSISYHWS